MQAKQAIGAQALEQLINDSVGAIDLADARMIDNVTHTQHICETSYTIVVSVCG